MREQERTVVLPDRLAHILLTGGGNVHGGGGGGQSDKINHHHPMSTTTRTTTTSSSANTMTTIMEIYPSDTREDSTTADEYHYNIVEADDDYNDDDDVDDVVHRGDEENSDVRRYSECRNTGRVENNDDDDNEAAEEEDIYSPPSSIMSTLTTVPTSGNIRDSHAIDLSLKYLQSASNEAMPGIQYKPFEEFQDLSSHSRTMIIGGQSNSNNNSNSKNNNITSFYFDQTSSPSSANNDNNNKKIARPIPPPPPPPLLKLMTDASSSSTTGSEVKDSETILLESKARMVASLRSISFRRNVSNTSDIVLDHDDDDDDDEDDNNDNNNNYTDKNHENNDADTENGIVTIPSRASKTMLDQMMTGTLDANDGVVQQVDNAMHDNENRQKTTRRTLDDYFMSNMTSAFQLPKRTTAATIVDIIPPQNDDPVTIFPSDGEEGEEHTLGDFDDTVASSTDVTVRKNLTDRTQWSENILQPDLHNPPAGLMLAFDRVLDCFDPNLRQEDDDGDDDNLEMIADTLDSWIAETMSDDGNDADDDDDDEDDADADDEFYNDDPGHDAMDWLLPCWNDGHACGGGGDFDEEFPGFDSSSMMEEEQNSQIDSFHSKGSLLESDDSCSRSAATDLDYVLKGLELELPPSEEDEQEDEDEGEKDMDTVMVTDFDSFHDPNHFSF